jgi:hypothetical protein
MYVDGTPFDFSYPTEPQTDTFTVAGAGTHNFTLNYAAWNGFPEVLQLDVRAVPIPSALLLVGSGLIPFIRLRRKRSVA